jgi:hypothetical protein
LVAEVDAHYERAKAAGATSTEALNDSPSATGATAAPTLRATTTFAQLIG